MDLIVEFFVRVVIESSNGCSCEDKSAGNGSGWKLELGSFSEVFELIFLVIVCFVDEVEDEDEVEVEDEDLFLKCNWSWICLWNCAKYCSSCWWILELL